MLELASLHPKICPRGRAGNLPQPPAIQEVSGRLVFLARRTALASRWATNLLSLLLVGAGSLAFCSKQTAPGEGKATRPTRDLGPKTGLLIRKWPRSKRAHGNRQTAYLSAMANRPRDKSTKPPYIVRDQCGRESTIMKHPPPSPALKIAVQALPAAFTPATAPKPRILAASGSCGPLRPLGHATFLATGLGSTDAARAAVTPTLPRHGCRPLSSSVPGAAFVHWVPAQSL